MKLMKERSSGQLDETARAQLRVPTVHRVAFLRNLAVLVRAGLSLPTALDVAYEQADHPALAEVIWDLRQALNGGWPLSQACGRFPAVFPTTTTALLKVAETTGRLHESLELLASWWERSLDQGRKVAAALTYPGFILTLTVVLSLGLLQTVVPQLFGSLVAGGARLPWPSQLLYLLSGVLASPGGRLALLALAAWVVWAGVQLRRRPELLNRPWLWTLALRTPGLGALLASASLARYCVAAEALLETGCDILAAVSLAATASGNPLLVEDRVRVRESIKNGSSLARSLRQRPELYGRFLPSLMETAEEVGSPARLFSRVRRFLEEDVEFRLAFLQQLLEPVLLVFLSGCVGFFVVACLLPLYGYLLTL